jgi:hypothetical protein
MATAEAMMARIVKA